MQRIKLISTHQQGKIIESEEGLQESLLALINLEPQIVLVELPNIGILTIGIGPRYGFVEYMANSGEPPYLLALKQEDAPKEAKEEIIEFDSGGTLTSIPRNKCIPTELVIRIAIDVYKNKKLPNYVEWEAE